MFHLSFLYLPVCNFIVASFTPLTRLTLTPSSISVGISLFNHSVFRLFFCKYLLGCSSILEVDIYPCGVVLPELGLV